MPWMVIIVIAVILFNLLGGPVVRLPRSEDPP